MGEMRQIRKVYGGKPVIEGAGVHLKRAFGSAETGLFDPFLMLDDFRSDNPAHFMAGFPWHPHRGIETITYVLEGDIEHGDSLGHQGVIESGDVQWMTAGSGILHQEMPKGDSKGRMYGFQLWANLPASHKMTDPKYRDVKASDIPTTKRDGADIKIICGSVDGVSGPVHDIVTDPEYLDVTVPPNSQFTRETVRGHTVLAYVIGGKGIFEDSEDRDGADFGEPVERLLDNGSLILFADGDKVTVSTEEEPVRFLLISGKPIGEPIAWRGPIVMNTQEELRVAFDELRNDTFIKHD